MLNEKDRKHIEDIWEKIDRKLSRVAVTSRNKIPYTTIDGVHDDKSKTSIAWWTNGFFPGLMWLMYSATKNEEYRITAETGIKILEGAFSEYDKLHHDVGFMFHISMGADYKLTGNEKSRIKALYAASLLAARFNHKTGAIRAWNHTGEGIAIIDCMMNIPLLYWASDVTGDSRFRQVAMAHADKTMKYHIRPDGSANHIVIYDEETGEIKEIKGGQGYDTNSSWSRGQAWALYGFILSYIHTQKEEYLDTAKKVAHYFISNICDDYLPRCDFRSPAEPVIYDSTAGAIAVCGLLEIANAVPEYEKNIYYNAAIRMIYAMEENFCDFTENEDAILLMGTEAYDRNQHIPIIYGDYFFTEAILKLRGNDFLPW